MSKIIVCLLSVLLSTPAMAASGNNNLGLGIILGAPTGLSANYKLSSDRSIDMALAYDFSGDGKFHVHSTYLFRYPESINFDELQVGWYTGLGARALVDNHRNRDDDFRLGIRGALGLSLELEKAPIEIFAELAPVMNIIEKTDLDLDAGLGLRYYF